MIEKKKVKTDRQIINYIANKIYNFTCDTEENIQDCIREALILKEEQLKEKDGQ